MPIKKTITTAPKITQSNPPIRGISGKRILSGISGKKVLSGRVRAKKPTWPFPPGIGDAIPLDYRKYEIPKDDYYYVAFSLANTNEETADNLELLAGLGVPFEYSMSPSGCICYRLHRQYEKHPAIQCPVGPRETVPVYLPGIQYGRKVQWRMYQQNSLYFLFKEWKPVPLNHTPRRRQRS